MHLLFPSGCQRCVKNSKVASLDESTIPDESVYGYHRKCYEEYTHKQKLKRMVENKQVAVEQRKSGRESRSRGTSNKLLNVHSLLREICVGEIPIPFGFHM